MEPRDVARQLAIGRVTLGAALMIAPRLSARIWLGPGGAGPAATILTRALGAREVVLGAGVLTAMRREGPVRGWIEAGAFVDAVDCALMLAAGDDVPALSRWGVAVGAGAGAAANAAAAPSVEQASDFEPRADA